MSSELELCKQLALAVNMFAENWLGTFRGTADSLLARKAFDRFEEANLDFMRKAIFERAPGTVEVRIELVKAWARSLETEPGPAARHIAANPAHHLEPARQVLEMGCA